jgi:hypothetical protein
VSRGPWPFKKTDLKRALKVAGELPDQVARVEITKDGGIALILSGAAGQPVSSTEEDWEKALAK